MGSPKRKKRSALKDRRYTTIHPDKPLTQKEQMFVYEYVKCKNGTEAAKAAGYSPRSAKDKAYHLMSLKPNTMKAIEVLRAKLFERLEHDVFDVLQGTCWIAMADATKLTPIKNGRVDIPDTKGFNEASRALFAGAKERVNEKGHRTIEVKMHDQLAAKKIMLEYFGAMQDSRQAQQIPLIEQQDAIMAVRNGKKTIVEACCDLEVKGIPLPETLRILLKKYAEVEGDNDDGDFEMPTAEEMEARRNERLAEIENEKKHFVPNRKADVKKLKEEMGKQNKAFPKAKNGKKS